MPYLTQDDLATHLYDEVIEEIVRNRSDLVTKAINTGVGLAKSHLNRYDLKAIFGDDTTEPTFKDDYLDSLVKDVVCWHLIKLSNPNINFEVFRTAYEDAVKEFEKIKKGITDPAWPLRPNDPTTNIDDAGNVEWASNTKRTNHF
jgi:hypothetical protein